MVSNKDAKPGHKNRPTEAQMCTDQHKQEAKTAKQKTSPNRPEAKPKPVQKDRKQSNGKVVRP